MTTTLYCVIFGLIGVIFVQAISHRIERKDLYNRIMCGSMKEFQNLDKPKSNYISKHRKVLNNWRKKEVE